MIGLSIPRYHVITMSYSGECTGAYKHRTLKAALRRLGSVIRGKQAKRDTCEAYIVDSKHPGERYSWEQARNIIEEGSP